MSTSRRDFIKTIGAGGVVLASGNLIADILAQSPSGNPMSSLFKGLSDIALTQAKTAGCSYADIRFTRNENAGAFANGGDRTMGGFGGFGGGGGRGGGRGRGGGGFGGFGGGNDMVSAKGTAEGFGVRVIHSGVWGFASSPIVTEDEIKRITLLATEVAKASAIAKRRDVQLAPVPAYQTHWATPVVINPLTMSRDDKQQHAQQVVDAVMKVKGVVSVSVSANSTYEWQYFASSEGSYIEQEIFATSPTLNVTARTGDIIRTRTYSAPAMTGGWEIVERAKLLENAERVANEAVEMTTAKPIDPGMMDLVLSPSHAMLTIHEIVAHATELDRILGYEANYAGTSFVKTSDLGKLKYGSKLFNVTADRNIPNGLGTVGYDDDGVKTQEWPLVREGILVGLQTNRETAHFIGEKESRGCTDAGSWRDYPFLRMPNVHVDAGPAGSPTLAEMIADTKTGVMIDGRGSYSIDQQRYNGQFGGNCFWEIKNGKKTRMVSNVTYNAITTDFWANLDALTGKDEWEMHGTGGDAKGQPTQSNSISHGSPWLRIKNIMVGAAFD